jgi:hypothetical protein
MVALTRDRGKRAGGRTRLYGCLYYHKRGSKVCGNSLLVRQEVLDRVLLDAIAEALDSRLLEHAIEAALTRFRAGQEGHMDRRTQVERELSLIEATEARLVDGIARGDAMDPCWRGSRPRRPASAPLWPSSKSSSRAPPAASSVSTWPGCARSCGAQPGT